MTGAAYLCVGYSTKPYEIVHYLNDASPGRVAHRSLGFLSRKLPPRSGHQQVALYFLYFSDLFQMSESIQPAADLL